MLKPSVNPGSPPDIRDGCEFEKEVPELVQVPADDRVFIEVHCGLNTDLVGRPGAGFRVSNDEGALYAFATVR